jgi:hypothetical protein
MQTSDKIRTPILAAERPDAFGEIKSSARRFLPFISKISLTGSVLLALQAVLVGAADRLGVSPKWSIILSGLFFAAVCGGLAVCGGVTEKTAVFAEPAETAEPVCKILMSRRREKEKNL